MKPSRLILSLYISILIWGCSSSETSLRLTNLGEAKNAVQNYYESGGYDRECSEIIDDAIAHIEVMKLSEKSSVVFDIDETALSNYEYTKEIGFGYIQKLWHESIQSGKLPAIKETKRFYDYLISKNIHVFFITGRDAEVGEATKRNLFEQGYTKFDTLIVRSENERKIPAAEFKAMKRRELVKRGYEIIACIGDQWSDLVGGNAGYKIKLPSYLYLLD